MCGLLTNIINVHQNFSIEALMTSIGYLKKGDVQDLGREICNRHLAKRGEMSASCPLCFVLINILTFLVLSKSMASKQLDLFLSFLLPMPMNIVFSELS